MGKIFIAENGTKIEAIGEAQEAAFKNAGLTEVIETKKK